MAELTETRSIPVAVRLRPVEWARRHLFGTWYDAALTVVFGGLFVYGAVWLIGFLIRSDFEILRVNLALFMVGAYPRAELWRPAAATVIVAALIGYVAGSASAAAQARAEEAGLPFHRARPKEVVARFWPVLAFIGVVLLLTSTPTPWLVVVSALIAGVVGYLAGRGQPAPVRRFAWVWSVGLVVVAYLVLTGSGIGWDRWGGFHLNLFLTVAGIGLAFPFGLILALGRRSSLPAVRAVSITYIEFIRGVPLITLLLMGIFALGFFLPQQLRPGDVTRVLVAIVLFEAAYVAEVVRGGLQAVPRGQVEAAQALGLSPWKTTRLIVLPQALRATIPAMVGQFISLFKDTTLVVVVGLIDILGASQAANSQPEFLAQGLHEVTLPFVGLAFWVGSYTMSREARRLEKRLGVGER
ncbi:MAG: polar amino acid ABC transporter permease [Acidimicrobiia bacterium]|nr:MAG: polar amino acid ABC transporter permease [Acidimicrobiia bacterium]